MKSLRTRESGHGVRLSQQRAMNSGACSGKFDAACGFLDAYPFLSPSSVWGRVIFLDWSTWQNDLAPRSQQSTMNVLKNRAKC